MHKKQQRGLYPKKEKQQDDIISWLYLQKKVQNMQRKLDSRMSKLLDQQFKKKQIQT